MKIIRYRVNPAVHTQIAMKVYYGPGEKNDNRWLDLSRGLYITEDEISHWTRLVTVMGPDADTVAQVRTWHEQHPIFKGGQVEHEVEVIRQDAGVISHE